MKNLLNNLTESIIIVCLAIIIVLPEIAYSLVLKGRDKLEDMWGTINLL